MSNSDYKTGLILNLIDMGIMVVTKVPGMLAAYKQTSDTLRAMVEEGRNPTEEEWKAAYDESNAKLATIRARADEAKERLE